MRDDCDGDPKVAYMAILLLYSPTTHGYLSGEQDEAHGSKKSAIYSQTPTAAEEGEAV